MSVLSVSARVSPEPKSELQNFRCFVHLWPCLGPPLTALRCAITVTCISMVNKKLTLPNSTSRHFSNWLDISGFVDDVMFAHARIR